MQDVNVQQIILLLSPAVMGVVAWLKATFDPKNNPALNKLWSLAGPLVGVLAALIWKVDAFGAQLHSVGRLQGVAGQILTGLTMGGLSMLWAGAHKVAHAHAAKVRAQAEVIAANPAVSQPGD